MKMERAMSAWNNANDRIWKVREPGSASLVTVTNCSVNGKMMERRRFLQEQAINSAMYYILEKSDTGAWGTTGIIGYLYIVV